MLGTTNYCYTQNIKVPYLMVSEKIFCKSTGDDDRLESDLSRKSRKKVGIISSKK